MTHVATSVLAILLLSGGSPVFATTTDAEFRVVRLSGSAALFQIGQASPTNVIVLAGQRGLVVVDTGVLPSRASALRSAIEREFGRKDVAYVVNTHAHFDHVYGERWRLLAVGIGRTVYGVRDRAAGLVVAVAQHANQVPGRPS